MKLRVAGQRISLASGFRPRVELTIKALRIASDTFGRTTVCSFCFGWGIRNVVTFAFTSTLERVVESNPVAGLVSRSATQICRSFSTSGESRVTNDDAIVLGVIPVAGGESGVSKETIRGFIIEGNGEDVENAGTAPPELFFHRFLFRGV